MRRVEQIMGMPIVVDIPGARSDKIFAEVFEFFRDIDSRFSPFKLSSELSQFNKGEMTENELSDDMRKVIKQCKKYQKQTDGYFNAWYKKAFDPSGYVKGWAVARAADLIKQNGHETFCINAGGDILAASSGQKIWQIGIQDPKNKNKILNMLSITNGAVATSGSYERGQHIINPKTGQPAKDLLSITVTGPDIIKADVLATAAFAMGKRGTAFVNGHSGYEAASVFSANSDISTELI